jgi:hypothetical protein
MWKILGYLLTRVRWDSMSFDLKSLVPLDTGTATRRPDNTLGEWCLEWLAQEEAVKRPKTLIEA